MPDPHMLLPTAQALLRPRARALVQVLLAVERVWQNELIPLHMASTPSGRAHVMNDLFYSLAPSMLAFDARIQLGTDQKQRFLKISDDLIVRFKQFDSNLRTTNYPTRHAKDWELQLPLDSMPVCARVNFGYRMDITGMVLEDAFFTLPNGRINEWVYQVFGRQIEPAVQMPLPRYGRTVTGTDVFAYEPVARA